MAKKVSESMSLIKEDMKKILIGAGMAAIGAFLTYVIQMASGIDYGEWTPAITAFLSILANVIRKWVASTQY